MTTDTITKTAKGEVLFLSGRAPDLWLVRRGAESRYSNVGQHIGDHGRVRYEFRDHQLRVREGQDVLADGPLDDDGEPTEQDAVSWLRSHPGFNGSEANGFHEHGNEPNRVPDPGPTLDQITNLAIYGQVDEIRELIVEERGTHAREIVLERAQAAVDSVEAALAASPPEEAENG